MSLLTIVQNASAMIGVPVPTTVINNSDGNVRQMLALSNMEGTELNRKRDWQELTVPVTTLTIPFQDQGLVTTVIGVDYDRMISGTMWDLSLIRPLIGPMSPTAWAAALAWSAAGPYFGFRIIKGHLNIFPVPQPDQRISWEYITKNWCAPAATPDDSSTWQSQWNLDSDIGLLDETMMTYGLVVRYKAAKGIDYAEDLIRYQDCFGEREASDGGNPRVISLSQRSNWLNTPYPNLPQGNWPR
jgi:hypothetical protein